MQGGDGGEDSKLVYCAISCEDLVLGIVGRLWVVQGAKAGGVTVIPCAESEVVGRREDVRLYAFGEEAYGGA